MGFEFLFPVRCPGSEISAKLLRCLLLIWDWCFETACGASKRFQCLDDRLRCHGLVGDGRVEFDFERADIIILKGMGAFESITEYNIEKPVFILLKAKCVTVARSLGVPQGRLVIKRIF